MKRVVVMFFLILAASCVFAQTTPNSFILVKGGTFQMGDTIGSGFENEKPIHKVQVASFYMEKFEVTQKEWQDVMGKNPSQFKGDGLPVENVSWEEAVEYCNLRSSKEKLTPCYSGSGDAIKCNFAVNGYRLPTEAEWEYAAKGGAISKGYKYIGADDIESVSWYSENAKNTTHPVGTKKPNELGLYDLGGNVIEWCWDWYADYGSAPLSDPRGPQAGSNRIYRGGNWLLDARNARASRRDYAIGVGFMFGLRGLRLVRSSL
jgi:formylglycine-generating enzyme required for sulfatase activity